MKTTTIFLKNMVVRGTSLVLAALFIVSISLTGNNAFTLNAATESEPLQVANEVVYDEETTENVSTPEEFVAAYSSEQVSRIVLLNDIDLSAAQALIRKVHLARSLQIDGGDGHTLRTTAATAERSDTTGFYLAALKGRTATLHLKNVNIWSRGLNYIDAHGSRSEGWQIILEDTKFNKNENETDQVQRVAKVDLGHVFFRGTVLMVSNAENLYVGQVTVEPGANVYGETNYYNYSTWWFSDSKSNGSVNIGQNATVMLRGFGGTTYPTIYQHWREINVHENAVLDSRKLGNVYSYDTTTGVKDKYINVFKGATFVGISMRGKAPVMRAKLSSTSRAHFYAAPGSHVNLIGASETNSIPIIKLNTAGSTFELDKPASYDLRNHKTTAKLVDLHSKADFIIRDSNIDVWKSGNGKNLDDVPDQSLKGTTVITKGSGAVIETSDPALADTWTLNDYVRISGDNTTPAPQPE